MRLEHHLVGGYVRYISPYIIIIIIWEHRTISKRNVTPFPLRTARIPFWIELAVFQLSPSDATLPECDVISTIATPPSHRVVPKIFC